MNNKTFLLSLVVLTCVPAVASQTGFQISLSDNEPTEKQNTGVCTVAGVPACGVQNCASCHPWQGRRVGFLGDSMTDPNNNSRDVPKKYWNYLQEWLGITPYVYGISGRQWNDIPNQARRLKEEHGDSVDAITVFIGTNDFNAGVPLGRWYDETEDTVTAAVHGRKQVYRRKRRVCSVDGDTFKGRINIAMQYLKTFFPDKQIVLLTPIHRAAAAFGPTNIQPDESWQNLCGEYFDAYVSAVKEAGNVWGVPVIDLNSVSGMNPMVKAQQSYFRDPSSDLLHPSDKGQRRIAMTLVRQLMSLPVF